MGFGVQPAATRDGTIDASALAVVRVTRDKTLGSEDDDDDDADADADSEDSSRELMVTSPAAERFNSMRAQPSKWNSTSPSSLSSSLEEVEEERVTAI